MDASTRIIPTKDSLPIRVIRKTIFCFANHDCLQLRCETTQIWDNSFKKAQSPSGTDRQYSPTTFEKGQCTMTNHLTESCLPSTTKLRMAPHHTNAPPLPPFRSVGAAIL